MSSFDSDSDSGWNKEFIAAVYKKTTETRKISEEDRRKEMQECLDQGADVNTVDENGNTALHTAVKKGYRVIVEFLRQNGASSDISNRKGQTAITLAENFANREMANILKNPINLPVCQSVEASDLKSSADNQEPSTSRRSDSTSKDSSRCRDDRSNQAAHGLKRKTTDDDDLDGNARKQRATSSNAPQRQSLLNDRLVPGFRATTSGGKSRLSENDRRVNKLPRLDDERPYTTSGLKRSLHGNIYQLKHLMLSLRRAWKMGYAFRLSTEVDAAEKFDDLVLHYLDNAGNEVHRFLQVKHKQDESKTISAGQLLDMNDGDFSLLKYFLSWRKIKKHSEFRGSRTKIFILCTNIGLDVNGLKTKKINVNEVGEPDEFLKVTDRAEQPPRYRLHVEKSSELHDTLKKASDVHILAREIAERVYSSEKIYLNNEIIKRYHAALAKEIINTTSKRFFPDFVQNNLPAETKKFRESFISHTSKLWGGKTSEDKIWKALEKTELKLSATFGKKTCTEEDLSSKLALPNDDIDDLEISNFLNEFILAVKQPNEIELGEMIRREIGADSQFNLLDAGFITDSFQTTVLDWFKGVQGEFLENEDAEDFFNDVEVKLGSLITLTLSLEYSEKLKEYGIEFNCKYTELQNFINSPNHPSPQILQLISSGQTLLTALTVYQTLAYRQKQEKNETYILIRLKTLSRQGITKKVLRAFQWPHNHNLLVVDCESSNAKRHLQKLWKPLCKIMAKNVHKRMIIIAQKAIDLGTNFKSIPQIHVTTDSYGFSNLANNSQSKLLRKRVSKFQGQKIETSFGALLGILDLNILIEDELNDLSEIIDSQTLIQLICNDEMTNEIHVGCDLKGLDEIMDYYINRTVFQRVVIREDILRDQDIPDLFAISGIDSKLPIELRRLGDTSWKTLDSKTDLFAFGSIATNSLFELEQYEQTSPMTQSPMKHTILLLDRTTEEEQFKSLCAKNERRNTHWLENKSGKYIWKKSQGDLTSLVKYRDVGESTNHNGGTGATDLVESQLAAHDEPVIISDAAGMGKSVLLTHLASKIKQNNPDTLVLNIDLNHHSTALKELGEQLDHQPGSVNGAVQFLVEKFLNEESNLAKKIFKRIICKRLKVALIFDGFDEICPDYEATVIDLLHTLKNSGIKKLYVATRPHTRETLERKLNAFSHEMRPLSAVDQGIFLRKYWKSELGDDYGLRRIEIYTEAIMKKLAESINDETNKFTGIPLRTWLVAEIFKSHSSGNREEFHSCEEFLKSKVDQPTFPAKINLVWLYEHFVKKDFDHYFKKQGDDANNLTVKSNRNRLNDMYMKIHEELALQALFEEENVKKLLGSRQKGNDKNNDLKRIGVIIKIIDDEAYFVHQTYAEYFAARFFSNMLKRRDQNESVKKIFVADVLLGRKYETMRVFMNWLLSEDHIELEADIWRSHLNIQRSIHKETVFHVAAAENNHRIIRLFLDCLGTNRKDREVLINVQDSLKLTAVHRAVEQCGDLEAVNLLVENTYYKIDSRDWEGRTPLYIASEESKLDVVKYLLDKEANVNRQNNAGWTPLHITSLKGEMDVVKYLLDKEANVNCQDNQGWMPLHLASQEGELDVVKYLLDKGANVNCQDDEGWTPLHITSLKGEMDVVKYLLDKEANVNCQNNTGRRPLHLAAQEGKLNVVKYLLDKGANVNCQDNEGCTPLHMTSLKGKMDVVKYLLDTGANVNCQNNTGWTPLHITSLKGEMDVVKYLLDKEANVNCEDNEGCTPLHMTSLKGEMDVVKYLLDKGANVNCQNNTGWTPLHITSLKGEMDVVKYLLDKGANANCQDNMGRTPLRVAAQEGKLDVVKYLLNKKANVNCQDNEGWTPLHVASQEGKLDVIKYLLDKEANVNCQNKTDRTPLHLASQEGKLDVVKYLLDREANVNCQDNEGRTPLRVASQEGKLDVVKYLLDKEANVNCQDNEGWTPLHITSLKGKMDVVKCLLDKGANVHCQNNEGCTPLHITSLKGEMDVLKYLLNKGANVNCQDNEGCTPLHITSLKGEMDVLKYLLNKGANVNCQDNEGCTPLHITSLKGEMDVVKYLLDKGANVNCQDNTGQTPLHLAAQEGKLNVVKYLLDKGGNVNCQDNTGQTPLHLAAQEGKLNVVKYLLDKGANVNR